MRRPLTADALLGQMERLNDVFNKFSDPDELMRAAVAYRDALEDWDLEQVTGAVSMAVKTERYFPMPSVLIQHARDWTKANRAAFLPVHRPSDGEVACPVCKATPRWAWLLVREGQPNEDQIKRCIAPCDPERHPKGGYYVPMPANFVAWMDEDLSPEEFVRAQPARIGREEA